MTPVALPARLATAVAHIPPRDEVAAAAAKARLDALAKPPGSLGRLEELVVWLAGVTGRVDAPVARRTIVVAAADHGVAARGVSAYPSSVTAGMVGTFVAGRAAVNVLAAAVDAEVVVLDVGVAGPLPEPPPGGGARPGRLVRARVRDGTADLAAGAAMTVDEAIAAIETGRTLAETLAVEGVDIVAVGEMGIGNTTAASALVAAFTGRPAGEVAGRGTGLDDAGVARKIATIERALALHRPDPRDAVGTLAAVGGLEIAALVGVILGAASARIPVVLDGFITGAAALAAARLAPAVVGGCVAAHRSTEPGHTIALEVLGLRPLLDLDLRLGEGSGAALALGLLDAAVRVRDGMATLADVGGAHPVAHS